MKMLQKRFGFINARENINRVCLNGFYNTNMKYINQTWEATSKKR